MRFRDRVVIVTGASRQGQIGAFVAAAFAAEGARVVVASRTARNVAAVADRLRSAGGEADGVAADLGTEAGAAAVVAHAVSRHGTLDVLVNLAGGLTVVRPAADLALADFERELASNLTTAFLCSRAVIPEMTRRGGGRIVNFSSLAAASPGPRMLAYNCAKAAVSALTRTLALELAPAGIAVNAIAPGLVDTESNVAEMQPTDDERARRWVSREAIARATLFLASEDAAGVTGQVLAVTGGVR
jgi:NAD(P)-dependent dehydrogenase (short-subunit alcohol dehydrogenase family)